MIVQKGLQACIAHSNALQRAATRCNAQQRTATRCIALQRAAMHSNAQQRTIVKSPLQCTLTAHIMSRWAKHEGALAHISLQRSVEMLALQCAQRFPARPADPDSSVFAELFTAPQPEPSQPNVPTAKAKQMHLHWNPLGFLSELSQQKSVTRFPPDVW